MQHWAASGRKLAVGRAIGGVHEEPVSFASAAGTRAAWRSARLQLRAAIAGGGGFAAGYQCARPGHCLSVDGTGARSRRCGHGGGTLASALGSPGPANRLAAHAADPALRRPDATDSAR